MNSASLFGLLIVGIMMVAALVCIFVSYREDRQPSSHMEASRHEQRRAAA